MTRKRKEYERKKSYQQRMLERELYMDKRYQVRSTTMKKNKISKENIRVLMDELDL